MRGFFLRFATFITLPVVVFVLSLFVIGMAQKPAGTTESPYFLVRVTWENPPKLRMEANPPLTVYLKTEVLDGKVIVPTEGISLTLESHDELVYVTTSYIHVVLEYGDSSLCPKPIVTSFVADGNQIVSLANASGETMYFQHPDGSWRTFGSESIAVDRKGTILISRGETELAKCGQVTWARLYRLYLPSVVE